MQKASLVWGEARQIIIITHTGRVPDNGGFRSGRTVLTLHSGGFRYCSDNGYQNERVYAKSPPLESGRHSSSALSRSSSQRPPQARWNTEASNGNKKKGHKALYMLLIGRKYGRVLNGQ